MYEVSIEDIILKYHKSSNTTLQPSLQDFHINKGKGIEIRKLDVISLVWIGQVSFGSLPCSEGRCEGLEDNSD